MKDILVLWDNSQSVGYKYFKEYTKPFLKNLVTSGKLNVAKEGTHIGFITFATEKKTRELLKIGEITDPDDLVNWLDSLNYDKDLRGDGTRTGLAMKIANDVSHTTIPIRVNLSMFAYKNGFAQHILQSCHYLLTHR